MADRVEWFDVTIAAGVARTAPVETATRFDPGIVDRIELTIPDGHAGLTGIRFLIAHQPIIPVTNGSFIVGNDRIIVWDTTNYLDNGAWSVQGYNTDVFSHTFHIAYLIRESSLNAVSAATAQQSLVVTGGIPQVYYGDTGTGVDMADLVG